MRSLFALACLTSIAWAVDPLPKLEITAKSGIIVDEVSGRVLWEKAPDVRRPNASTTKVLTTLMLLDEMAADETITAPNSASKIGGSSLNLKPGERISVQAALYAMMLRSANDVCHAVAVQLAGSEAEFAFEMNERAKSLGMVATHFTNPHGLPDPKHLTTARDLSILARAAMQNETFRQIAATQRTTIERSLNQADRLLINRNKWLAKDPTADGIKTGYTEAAGHCYIGSARRNGFRVITVILGSPDSFADHQKMLDWAYRNYQIGLRKEAEKPALEVAVEGGDTASIPVALAQPIQVLNRRGATKPLELQLPETFRLEAPVQTGQIIGQAEIVDADGFVTKVPLKALDEVKVRPSLLARVQQPGNAVIWVGGALALFGAFAIGRRRVRRF